MRQRLYKFYEQWIAFDLHRNNWLKNEIDELMVACIFQVIQTKDWKLVFQIFFHRFAAKRLVYSY